MVVRPSTRSVCALTVGPSDGCQTLFKEQNLLYPWSKRGRERKRREKRSPFPAPPRTQDPLRPFINGANRWPSTRRREAPGAAQVAGKVERKQSSGAAERLERRAHQRKEESDRRRKEGEKEEKREGDAEADATGIGRETGKMESKL